MSHSETTNARHPDRATDHLLGKMWKTKSSRFNAQARLRTRYWASVAATSLLSFYLVAASLMQLAFDDTLDLTTNKLLSVGNVIVSVLLIVVTLLETAKDYAGEADRMHKSALAIAELYNRFQALTIERADEQRTAFNDLYSSALKDNPVEHKDIDFQRFRLRNANDLGISRTGFVAIIVNFFRLWLLEYWLYTALIFLPLCGVVAYFVFIQNHI